MRETVALVYSSPLPAVALLDSETLKLWLNPYSFFQRKSWLCWVFSGARAFCTAASRGCSQLWAGFREAFAAELRLRALAQQVWLPGSAAPQHGIPPRPGTGTQVPCTSRQVFNCLTTGKVLNPYFNEITCREDLKGVELEKEEKAESCGVTADNLCQPMMDPLQGPGHPAPNPLPVRPQLLSQAAQNDPCFESLKAWHQPRPDGRKNHSGGGPRIFLNPTK